MTASAPKSEIKDGKAPCDDCGAYNVETMQLPMSGRVVAKGRYCDACQAKRDEAEEQAKIKQAEDAARWRMQNIEDLLVRAGVPRRYLKCSLESFIGARPNVVPSYLWGPVGSGKTHLAVGFIREAILHRGKDAARFLRAVDLFKEIRDTFQENSAESEKMLLEDFGKKVPLLVIDDLGTEKVSDWVEQTLYDLIDRRYGEELQTLITSNLSPDELEAHYKSHGDRLMSRIMGMGESQKTKGADRRIKKGTTQA